MSSFPWKEIDWHGNVAREIEMNKISAEEMSEIWRKAYSSHVRSIVTEFEHLPHSIHTRAIEVACLELADKISEIVERRIMEETERRREILEDRKSTLLKAAYDILKKQEESHYVLNSLETTANWDDAECDGFCLMEEIAEILGIED